MCLVPSCAQPALDLRRGVEEAALEVEQRPVEGGGQVRNHDRTFSMRFGESLVLSAESYTAALHRRETAEAFGAAAPLLQAALGKKEIPTVADEAEFRPIDQIEHGAQFSRSAAGSCGKRARIARRSSCTGAERRDRAARLWFHVDARPFRDRMQASPPATRSVRRKRMRRASSAFGAASAPGAGLEDHPLRFPGLRHYANRRSIVPCLSLAKIASAPTPRRP